MHHLPDKQRLSLLITDSGLGGLSICAGMVKILTERRAFSELKVVYFNAWPLPDKGYNFLDGDAERMRVFANALRGMNRYTPDLIFIACNTLSLIYQQGGLTAIAGVPVVDIIEFGVDMIADQLNRHPSSTALILGTRTTVSSGTHKKLLVERGIAGHRIVQQQCHGLASAIEADPNSPEVHALVDRFMGEAAAILRPGVRHLYAGLCCTHFGYIQTLIRQRLAHHSGARVDIINPNQGMIDDTAIGPFNNRFASVKLDVSVVSKVPVPVQKIEAIARLVEPVSPPTARALKNYQHRPTLFDD
jgi:glutamate racemase